MPHPAETPAPPAGPLVTGHFHKGPRYATYRETGTHDWLLVYTASGRGRFGHADGELPAGPGDMILLKPNVLHDYGTARGHPQWELFWAHFIPRPAWLELLDWPEAAPGVMRLPLAGDDSRYRIVRRFRELVRLNSGPSRLREPLALNALEEILLRCEQANPRGAAAGLDHRISRSLAFICENFPAPLTVAKIATQCGLSPSRFAHLFRTQTGQTPQRYLELQRLTRARQLLEFTQEPVSVIARQVGFENPFYFTLRFRRHNGASPRDWRNRQSARR
ncbi:MAG: helix-turn-helix domain-containing protein [Opitutaceae bacterium]|nr:helix-turn-helix domain-containing protein [Opitutaceae bacterium]